MFPVLIAPPERQAPSPYSARLMAKPVHFYYANPAAKSVSLTGDFNAWHPDAHPMRRREDGWWFIEVPLRHGHHQYLFLVDGQPMLDPQASGIARNYRNERVSLVFVG